MTIESTNPGQAWVQGACTLPTAQQPSRIAEFDALFATAVENAERLGAAQLRLTFAGDAGVEATVRDLTTRETQCCSFFQFTVTGDQDRVVLDITVPDAHVAVLEAMAARANALRGIR